MTDLQARAEAAADAVGATRDFAHQTFTGNEERFWDKVCKSDDRECWDWKGTISTRGYGLMSIGGKRFAAHRLAFETLVEAIHPGNVIDHLCRNRRCVNPRHLQQVTNRENVVRGIGPILLKARHRAVTHCQRGHEYSPDNTKVDKRGRRACRICQRRMNREHYRRKTGCEPRTKDGYYA